MEKADSATVDVNFKPESGITSPADAERELLLRRSLEEVVLRSRYPRCVVSVVIQVRLQQQYVSVGVTSCLSSAFAKKHEQQQVRMYQV